MIENKIHIVVRHVELGGPAQATVRETSANGIYLDVNEMATIGLSYNDWMKVLSAIKTMGILTEEDPDGHSTNTNRADNRTSDRT